MRNRSVSVKTVSPFGSVTLKIPTSSNPRGFGRPRNTVDTRFGVESFVNFLRKTPTRLPSFVTVWRGPMGTGEMLAAMRTWSFTASIVGYLVESGVNRFEKPTRRLENGDRCALTS